MQRDDRDQGYLWDILSAAHVVRSIVESTDKGEFEKNVILHSAAIRQLEIIGEATKRLSTDFREAHPGIPWRQVAAMRDFLIHVYDKVNMETVWETATVNIPETNAYIEPLLPDLPEGA